MNMSKQIAEMMHEIDGNEKVKTHIEIKSNEYLTQDISVDTVFNDRCIISNDESSSIELNKGMAKELVHYLLAWINKS